MTSGRRQRLKSRQRLMSRQRLKSWLHRAAPQPETWRLIGKTYRWSAALLILIVIAMLAWPTGGIEGLLGVLAIMGLLLLIGSAIWLLLALVSRMSPGLRAGFLLMAVPVVPIGVYSAQQYAAVYVFLILTLALIATGVLRLRQAKVSSGVLLLAAGALPLIGGVVAFSVEGWQVEETAVWIPIAAEPVTLPNPAAAGESEVLTFSYGSGGDRTRDHYAADADWTSRSVDGSKLIDGWDGVAGWARSRYWGFDAEALPVQGRVWMPDGDGIFPLVLIVHGNHEGPDVSDVGYNYLGELFASRGIITVSVDENFLNSFMGDFLAGPDGGLEEESDARAWMLLQHLAQWRDWSSDPGHPMYGKADLTRVVLIGHSRGGEAVSEAVLFNRLERYPDDGTLDFNFGFGIQGIIAIAPVDHQYNPRDRATEIKDTNLLVIHGSHDADVDAFVGSAMYSRLEFDKCADCFKSSLYLLDANHGQFNTSWGEYDSPFPPAAMLNVVPLMKADSQQEVARVLFAAFLETLFFEGDNYRSFLARPEIGAHWLPEEAKFLSNYSDARMILLADFEEDADLSTAGGEVAELKGKDLDLWKEAEVPLRWQDMDTAAVQIGWGSSSEAEPVYEMRLLDGGLAVSPDMAFSFASAMGTAAPPGVEEFEAPETLSFEIVLLDITGQSASVALSDRRPLYPQVDPTLFKLESLADRQASEPTFQRYVFAFKEWQRQNPALDLSAIAAVRFRFPADVPASVWLDDIAISPDGL